MMPRWRTELKREVKIKKETTQVVASAKLKKEEQLYIATNATVGVALRAWGSCLRSYEQWTMTHRIIVYAEEIFRCSIFTCQREWTRQLGVHCQNCNGIP